LSEHDSCEYEDGVALDDSEVTVSKLEAARTQLETAITLFFQEGDAVSVHTLVAAAHTIVQDVNKSRGGSPMLMKDLMISIVPQSKRKEVHEKLNRAENFFKHADRDPNGTLTFRPSVTPFLIFDAALKYHEMTNETPAGVNIFMWWMRGTMPELFPMPQGLQEKALYFAPMLRNTPRRDFLAVFETIMPNPPDFFGPRTHNEVAKSIADIQQRASDLNSKPSKGRSSS
jgi:hypothetical protein